MATMTGRQQLQQLLSLMVALLGATVIAGWYLHIPLLLQIHPSFVAMTYNTALAFLLSALAIVFLQRSQLRVTRFLAMGVLLLGGLNLFQTITGLNLHVDQFLMQQDILVKTTSPGRMAPNTAVCFILTALALLIHTSSPSPRLKAVAVDIVAPCILALSMIAVAGYVLESEAAYGWGNLTRMAAHTSVGFIVLGLALLLVQVPGQRFNALPGIGIALLVLVLTLWQALRTEQVNALQTKTKQSSEQIQSNWQLRVELSLKALQRMAARWGSPGGGAVAWRIDAANYLEDLGYLSLSRHDDSGAVSVLGDSRVAEQVLAHLSPNPCRMPNLPSWQLVERQSDPSDRLVVQVIALSSARQGNGCIIAVNSLRSQLDEVRQQVRSQRFPWELSLNDRPIFQEVSDGTWSTQAALYPDQAGLTLSLTPTRAQLEGSAQPEWVLIAGLAMDSLIVLVLFWIGVARRKAQESLALQDQIQSELALRQHVIENAPYGIFLVNQAGTIEMSNRALNHLFGYSAGELVGQSIEILVPSALHETHAKMRDTYHGNAAVARKMAAGRYVSGRRRDGGTIEIEVNLAPVDFGDRHCVIAMVVDVRERLEAQRLIEVQMEHLTRVNEELNSFTYVASHDLKSPLRGIDQLASWIAEDLGDTLSGDTQEHLRLMRSRIKRMEMLLDDLLAYSRAGRSNDEIISINSRELVENIFELQASNKPIDLVVADDVPVLNTQKVPLELVFRNLIGNAIKHHDKPQGTIRISAIKKADSFEFTVQDDGPGIPPEHQQRVFAMFQTLKPRDEIEGSGIGLALVKKAVESVGGTVTVESDGQQGCTFRFTWPIINCKENT